MRHTRSDEARGVPHAFLSEGQDAYRSPMGIAQVRHEPADTPGTWLLNARGEFDSETVHCLHEALDDAREARAERVLLDLTGVVFGDSSFLDELVRAHHGPGRLVLIGPFTSQVRRLFEITGTRRLFHTAMDRASAGVA